MTQEYTPVAWQDETTSQQGTLINAERLNQMQTAHHYADGFEEVDEIPTADPGVSYHKVVYCTADSTFYRWDGTEWTADIDDDTKRLLEQEISRATAAEGKLAQDIADETARATAQEQDLASRITAEASARNQADTALGNRITAEATARESADTELGADIGAETARARQAEQANAQAIATHVADKQNPHEVTKAQVGLGNVDNTADLDKPISTATQTALNEKASTTAVQAVTARVDTLESAVADTYNKAQIDTYLAGKADQATTYTKTETDTLLAGKADKSDTYTKTEVQTYVSNALDGYEPMVRTTGNQTIAGLKIFIDPPAGHRTNSRTNAYSEYYTIMKLGLRGDGTNRQVLGGLISQYFGIIQIDEPRATSISVTDIMGTFSSLLDFALYTDGLYHYVAVKQKTNNTFAYELGLMAANKGNYGMNSGDIQVYSTLSAVNTEWTLVASTEGA